MEMTRREFAKGGLATFGGCACLHVGERKPATVACKVSKFGVLRVERLRLGFEGGEVDASQVSLNFIEVKPPVDGVLADETRVDFGDWAIVLHARNDGAAWRFETKFEDGMLSKTRPVGMRI